jgi:hypothetical protein
MLFIVSPKRPDLFEALNAALRRERGVEVIYDRRAGLPARGDRARGDRRAGLPTPAGRPRGDRRRQKVIDDEIAEYGWAVVNASS